MHVHTSIIGGRNLLALYVANGVTGVRDMAGDWETLTGWRKEIAAGRLVGPRIVASGPYLEGGDVPIPHILTRTPDEGRAGVDSLVKLGVDFIKVHGQLTRETYFAIARRARERGIVVRGACVARRRFGGRVGLGPTKHRASVGDPRAVHACRVDRAAADASRCRERWADARRRTSRRCTRASCAITRGSRRPSPRSMKSPSGPATPFPATRSRTICPRRCESTSPKIFPMPDSIPPGADSVGRAMFAKRLRQVATMYRAGVQVLTGTDAPLRNSPPGFGLHEELELLVRGGLTPFEALRAATLEPANYFVMRDSVGAVAPGQLADLVLLDANPLRDIGTCGAFRRSWRMDVYSRAPNESVCSRPASIRRPK